MYVYIPRLNYSNSVVLFSKCGDRIPFLVSKIFQRRPCTDAYNLEDLRAFSGFRRDINEICALLVCYTAQSTSSWLLGPSKMKRRFEIIALRCVKKKRRAQTIRTHFMQCYEVH